jgi:hypothetical protein
MIHSAEYEAFLASKAIRAKERGIARAPDLAPHLFQFQNHVTDFALRAGCAGIFLDTGLGKTEIQLEWCQKAIEETNGRALILTPLAVAGQTKRRADRWGYEARVIREQADARPGINICNYDRIDKLDPSQFSVVSLDEASILKNFTGKTTRKLIDAFKGHRFKLVATATPAPNDYMELGQYCEFLEVMRSSEMLMRWFIADQAEMGRYRLKGHAFVPFWDWMASYCRMAERPSDLGDQENDARFVLPSFEVVRHRARDSKVDVELSDMFGLPSMSATNLHTVKRQTSEARAETVASVVAAEAGQPWIIWVDTDYEADAVRSQIPDAIEIRGSQSIDEKESKLAAFERGNLRLIAKPSMCGHGLDWSHCARMAFVGRSYSYETWYQAVRRCWRFGQTKPVKVHLVVAEGEAQIGRVIDRKGADHAKMKSAMRNAMVRATTNKSSAVKVAYNPTHTARLPSWICAA